VRRLWPLLLLAAFSVPLIGALIGPALLASEVESKLPPAAAAMESIVAEWHPSHRAMPSLRVHCFALRAVHNFPARKSLRRNPAPGVIGNTHGISAAGCFSARRARASEILFHVSYNRAGQKRGPPSLLSLA
jgi:hypothetical protein